MLAIIRLSPHSSRYCSSIGNAIESVSNAIRVYGVSRVIASMPINARGKAVSGLAGARESIVAQAILGRHVSDLPFLGAGSTVWCELSIDLAHHPR